MKYIYLLIATQIVAAALSGCSSNPQQRAGGNSCISDCRRQYTNADKQNQCVHMCH